MNEALNLGSAKIRYASSRYSRYLDVCATAGIARDLVRLCIDSG